LKSGKNFEILAYNNVSIYICKLFFRQLAVILKHSNFSEGVHYFEMMKSCTEIGLAEPFVGDVLLKCKLDRSVYQIIIDCDLEVNAEFVCDRCAEEIESTLENHFQNVYIFGKESSEESEDNIAFLHADTDKIDLTESVIEFANLAIPMKILCKDECKGLCFSCGKNLNVSKCKCKISSANNVWEPLKQLKKKLN